LKEINIAGFFPITFEVKSLLAKNGVVGHKPSFVCVQLVLIFSPRALRY